MLSWHVLLLHSSTVLRLLFVMLLKNSSRTGAPEVPLFRKSATLVRVCPHVLIGCQHLEVDFDVVVDRERLQNHLLTSLPCWKS
jgi:hypothetical protein